MARAAAETITFACSHCGRSHRVPASWAGRRGRCPACSKSIRVPGGAQACPDCRRASEEPGKRCKRCRLGARHAKVGALALHEHGLRLKGGPILFWRDVADLDEDPSQQVLRIYPLDGSDPLVLDLPREPGVVEQAQALSASSVRRNLPVRVAHLRGALAGGATLDYGPCRLTSTALELDGRRILYPDVLRLRSQGDRLRLQVRGRWRALQLDLRRVPRREELLLLLDGLLSPLSRPPAAAPPRGRALLLAGAVALVPLAVGAGFALQRGLLHSGW